MPPRILLATFDGGGNLPPLVAIARELVNRGDEVRVIAGTFVPGGPPSARLRDALEHVGCEVANLAAPTGAGEPPSTESVVADIPREFVLLQGLVMFASLASHWALAVSTEILGTAAGRHPRGCVPAGCRVRRRGGGFPYVVLQHTILDHRLLPPAMTGDASADSSGYRDVFAKAALPHLNEARDHLGLPHTTDAMEWELAAAGLLVLTSPAFDDVPEHLPPTWRYTGAVLDDPSLSSTWDSPWPVDDARPLVVASSTTTGLAAVWRPAITSIIEACVDLPIRVLLTIGTHLQPSDFPHHENICIRDRVPHDAVLPQAAMIISQCGHGTVMAALRQGVPIVCIPGFGDQPEVAARIVQRGAGVRLRTRPSPEDVRAAVSTLLTDPSYRQAAARLGDIISRERGAFVAANAIEAALRE